MTGQKPPRAVPLDARPLPAADEWAETATAPHPAQVASNPAPADPAEEWAQHPTVPVVVDATVSLDAAATVRDDDEEEERTATATARPRGR